MRPVLVLLALFVAAAGSVAGTLHTPAGGAGLRELVRFKKCGVERWTVKTLQDRPKLRSVKTATVAELSSKTKPDPLPGDRAPFERNVYRVTAGVTEIIGEADGDLHLVLTDGADQMIAETPIETCTVGATDLRRTQIREARAVVRLCGKAEITGVAFFDFFHSQTGVAPNEIELHPILGFRCLSP